MSYIKNYQTIYESLERVTLLAVTKYQSDSITLEAVQQWITLIWESKVQDSMRKYTLLKDEWLDFSMQLIGHLQTNKVADAVQIYEMIQSVDSERVLRKIDSEAGKIDKSQRVLLQVNLTCEEQKYGFESDELWAALTLCEWLEHVTCEWLMCMWVLWDDEKTREMFRKCRSLCDQYKLDVCSMGMSHDREIALQEWSTMIRLGSALFD